MASAVVGAASRGFEKHRKSFSLLFYRAVRDLKPVWMLEDMRTMEAVYQEEDDSLRIYTPSEALLYAIVHDHHQYAQYLLGRYSDEALAKPGERFCCCPSSAPHLAMAVRYDRRSILGLILQQTHRGHGVPPCAARAGRCYHTEDGRTPLHLACELSRPEVVLLLLGNGESPLAQDHGGLTPLDVVLEKLRDCGAVDAERRQCLDNLLMFTAKVGFKMKADLDREPERWSELLGEETFAYLSGRSPAPLLLSAMQTILKQLRPDSFPDSLHRLPIPSSLKPAGLPASQTDTQRLQ